MKFSGFLHKYEMFIYSWKRGGGYPQKQGISVWKTAYKLERANRVSQLTLEMTHMQVQPRKRIIHRQKY